MNTTAEHVLVHCEIVPKRGFPSNEYSYASNECVLVLDDVHRLLHDERFAVLMDTNSSDSHPKYPLILTSRENIPSLAIKHTLKGMSKDAVEQFLKHRGIVLPHDNFEQLYATTKGLPKFVELFAFAFVAQPNDPSTPEYQNHCTAMINNLIRLGNIRGYIASILSKLTDEEKRFLEFISIFRYPIDVNNSYELQQLFLDIGIVNLGHVVPSD